MDLQEFVKTAVTQVVAGVAEARDAVQAYGANVGSDPVYGHVKESRVITDANGRQLTLIEFDIALTQADSKDTKGGIGVFLGSVGLGSQAALHGEASSHSRIKFSVPVVLPGAKR